MRIVGIRGSPKKGNAELMLKAALEGAKAKGIRADMILLRVFDLEFVGKERRDDFERILLRVRVRTA